MKRDIDYITLEAAHTTIEFGERLASNNDLYDLGFKEWVFYPGMLFNSPIKWWGDQGKRSSPHEGLDICFYNTDDGQIRHLYKETGIPVMYEGNVVKVANDFLGESVFACHNIYSSYGEQLLTIYGHIKPDESIHQGKRLREGDLIGTIAEAEKNKAKIPSHVHISMAWISKPINYEELDWKYIANPAMAVLLDPLKIINIRYSILGNF